MGAAQWPYLLPETLTIDQAAGDSTTLTWVIVVFLSRSYLSSRRSRSYSGSTAQPPRRGGGVSGVVPRVSDRTESAMAELLIAIA